MYVLPMAAAAGMIPMDCKENVLFHSIKPNPMVVP